MRGSIEHVKDDKYRLRVTTGYNDKGNPTRKNKTVSAKNKRDADFQLMKWIIELEEKGVDNLQDITFKNFYHDHWLATAEQYLEPSGFHSNRKTIEERFLEPLGKKKLRDIKPYEIKQIILNAKRLRGNEEELSRNTKKRMLSTLSAFFSIAKDEYHLIVENPCEKIKIPAQKGYKKKTQQPYSTSEIELMLEKLENEELRTKANILTAFITGARAGEIAALEEKHLNFQTNEITFNQRIIAIPKKPLQRLDGLKASDSKTMTVPKSYMNIMFQLISENRMKRNQLGILPYHTYIFGNIEGKPMRPDNLYQNWERFVKRNNLRMIRYHDLRHTSATYLISNLIPTKTVQERLGHADYRTTMNLYVHGLKEVDEQASNEFDSLLKKHN